MTTSLIIAHCGAYFMALVNNVTGETLVIDDGMAWEDVVEEYDFDMFDIVAK